ncbi:MarR family EPS-associated transcriptional regulator [Jhaorihella thermophila]|uniref:MarR family EPS-associated transcriptional regulator n=1 Tax=Jhaorihella thermophila TaxID=488547 RepID=UPI000CDEAAC9|nr:MarR family EPS-associated transcriptional regulator [Jhaorihella thermophila]
MTSKRSKLQEDTRFRVLRLLQQNPEMSQRDLAKAVGISVGGTHYVLNALIEKGLVKLGNFTAAKDKRRYAYVLTPKGIAEKAELTRRFLSRKMEEFEALREEIDALSAEVDNKEMPSAKGAPRTRIWGTFLFEDRSSTRGSAQELAPRSQHSKE